MEKQLPVAGLSRFFGALLGIALLLATALFLPFSYLIGLVVVFRAEYFLSERFARSRQLYILWIGLLAMCVFIVALSLVMVMLGVY